MSLVLEVDLSTQTWSTRKLPERVTEDFLGGRGLGAYLLYRMLPPGVDPLGPDNLLVFTGGPLQGTNAPFSSKTVLSTKSPLTGIYLYSVASGRLGHQLRKAGYDALVIRGQAEAPLYLVIRGREVSFHPAVHLWGTDTITAHDRMLAEAGTPQGACACIGQAGEAGLLLACVHTEGQKARTFGRGGPGAVFGAKRLKGLVIEGVDTVPVSRPEAFREAKRRVFAELQRKKAWAEERSRYGTGADIPALNKLGILPTRNWQTGYFPQAGGIAPTETEAEYPRRTVPCAPFCPNPCSHILRIEQGPYAGVEVEGPEYETMYVFGSNTGNARFDAIAAAEEICDRAGLDTMSVGVAIGFAMECYERGLLQKSDLDGLELRFGDDQAMVSMVRLIARNQGFGQVLGQGVRHAAKSIPGSENFAIHMKGLEPGGYECRGAWGQALQFMLNSRGGCHHGYGLPARSETTDGSGTRIEGKGEQVREMAVERILMDSAVVCGFARRVISTELLADMMTALTGLPRGPEELRRSSLRILTLERLFNVREGIRRQDDTLPPRLLEEPLPDGPNRGSVVPRDALLDEGYRALGWDLASGIPLPQTVAEFGLSDLVKQEG